MIGVLDMGEKFGPFTNKVSAPPEQISGGAHVGRINIGHRHHASPEQDGDLMGVDLVVFRLAAVDRFHI